MKRLGLAKLSLFLVYLVLLLALGLFLFAPSFNKLPEIHTIFRVACFSLILLILNREKTKMRIFNIDEVFRLLVLASIVYLIGGAWIFVIVAFVVYAYLLFRRGKYVKKQIKAFRLNTLQKKPFLTSVGLGLVVPFLVALPSYLAMDVSNIPNYTFFQLSMLFLSSFLFSLFFTAVFEEILIRGFLWGLIELRNSRGIAFTATSIIFWVMHFRESSVTQFWLVTPFISLLLGYLTYRAKSLIPAITFHSLFNSMNYIVLPILFYITHLNI